MVATVDAELPVIDQKFAAAFSKAVDTAQMLELFVASEFIYSDQFSAFIRKVLTEKNLDDRSAAELIDVDESVVERWRTGATCPHPYVRHEIVGNVAQKLDLKAPR